MRQEWIATLAVLLPLLGACSGASAPPAATAAEETGLYVIGPGDQLGIFVYGAPQLSVTIPVRPDGHMSSPLISDIVAAGKTPPQLAQDIAEQLKQYIVDPNVTVMVQNFIGPFDRQIRVIGEAAEPQAIAFRQHMTVLDVMIQTKGLTRFAAGNRSILVRRVNGQERDIPIRLADLIKDGDIRQNVELQPGDTLIIPQSWF
jgi:polysaccharide export outer membrane protein